MMTIRGYGQGRLYDERSMQRLGKASQSYRKQSPDQYRSDQPNQT